MAGIPGPQERPDLYDHYDGSLEPRPEGWKSPVDLPPIDELKAVLNRVNRDKDRQQDESAKPTP